MGKTSESKIDDDSRWMESIKMILGASEYREACFIGSIQRVTDKHGKLINDEAYKPHVVSIGPLHHRGRSDLLAMEMHKWSYMSSLLQRNNLDDDKLDNLLEFHGRKILALEDVIRDSYGENITPDRYELAKLMLVDGCFVLELLLRLYQQNKKPSVPVNQEKKKLSIPDDPVDPILRNADMIASVARDLSLLENQIPFFVLKTLSGLIPDELKTTFNVAKQALNLFIPLVNPHQLAHAVHDDKLLSSSYGHLHHLLHKSCLSSCSIQKSSSTDQEATQELKYCATKLVAAGVKFGKSNESVKDIFQISFSNGELSIPQLQIQDTTECIFRNFIAWEKGRTDEEHGTIQHQFTSYALFFKGLICCPQDVELLCRSGIIYINGNGNGTSRSKEEELRTLFSRVTKGVLVGQFITDHYYCYGHLCDEMNKFYENKAFKKWHKILGHQWDCFAETVKLFWKHQIVILISDHFPDMWKTLGVIAAVMLLVLTILQTYYSAK
ncbi:UPF0481 protein [Quillaja saponaria]|uniref:UPF0481 protein n=1 Tax=Quillaja saponaria TaxID=32244 RepID=A0AAD7L2D7_QUISA|nr:UPF0481 protein [Quillaja saponaria]